MGSARIIEPHAVKLHTAGISEASKLRFLLESHPLESDRKIRTVRSALSHIAALSKSTTKRSTMQTDDLQQRRIFLTTLAGLALASLTGCGGGGGAAPGTSNRRTPLLIPAYFIDPLLWAKILPAHNPAHCIIANVSSGPGLALDPIWPPRFQRRMRDPEGKREGRHPTTPQANPGRRALNRSVPIPLHVGPALLTRVKVVAVHTGVRCPP